MVVLLVRSRDGWVTVYFLAVRTMKKRRSASGSALEEVLFACVWTAFRIRAAGQHAVPDAMASWGGGIGGFLRSLKVGGPQTVPQLARARPVARQRIQRLADECAASGLVEFIDNPAHRRSKLVRLTRHGEATCDEIFTAVGEWCESLATDLDAGELETTHRVLRRIGDKLMDVIEV